MVSRSLFLKTRWMRALKLPEARTAIEEAAVVAAVDAEAVVAVVVAVADKKKVKDPLVKIADLRLRVVIDLLVNVVRDSLTAEIADLRLKVAREHTVMIVELTMITKDLKAREEEEALEVASEVDVAVLSLSLTLKAVLMLDLPAVMAKYSVEAVVDSVVKEERVVSVEAVEDSVVVIERKTSEEAVVVSEVAIIPDLTIHTPLTEEAREEEAKALAQAEAVLPPQILDQFCG